MPLAPGTRLGPFEILSRLGAGGMGEVWRARDTRLQREVAIKVLPAALAGDAERLARFDREARLLASMNHPRIGGLLGLEDAEGVPALVLELIEGPTLAEHLARRGALPAREALTLALQIAEAIEYAHERGIVHRDLKPANVKFTADDSLKVLDFGLAKALQGDEAAEGDAGLSHSPTVTLGTHVGTLLGTAAYMAPEQARGKPVDRRADIWAFGVVLFEMLAGRALFGGDTVSDTIARILEREPDWSLLPANTPERVRELLARCLTKDARQRLRDIGDARHELEAALREIESGVVPPRAAAARPRGVPPWAWGLAGAAVVASFAGGFALRGARGAAPASVVRATLTPPPDLLTRAVMPAPDGRAVYTRAGLRAEPGQAAAPSRIYRRALDDFTWRPLAGTEGVLSYDLAIDGRWLYFVAPTAPGSARLGLSRMAVDGSAPPTALMPWNQEWDAWEALPDERFVVFSVRRDSVGVFDPARASAPTWRPLKKSFDIQRIDLTTTLPDGRACLGSVGHFTATGWTVDAVALDLKTAELSVILPNSVALALLPGNRLLLTRGPTMLASTFDVAALKPTGAPITVLDGLRVDNNWGHGRAGFSGRGDLVYPGGTVDPGRRRIALLTADGRWEDWNGEVGPFERAPALSPDGRVAIVTTVPPGSASYELVVLTRGQRGARRLAAEPGEDCTAAVVAPDGRRLAFMRQGVGATAGIYEMPLDGSAPPRLLLAAQDGARAYDVPMSWTPDGRSLFLQTIEPGRSRLRCLTPGAGAPRELNASRRNAWAPMVSPDGTRLAFLTDEAGNSEARVAALRPDGTLGAALQVSNSEATSVAWRPEGDGLVYTTPDKMLMECRIGPDLTLSAPTARVSLVEHVSAGDDYALLPGDVVVVTHLAENEGYVRQFNLVLGFAGEVERMMTGAGK